MMLRIGLVEAIQTPKEFILLLISMVTLPFTASQDHGLDVILFNSALPWGERYQNTSKGSHIIWDISMALTPLWPGC